LAFLDFQSYQRDVTSLTDTLTEIDRYLKGTKEYQE
jgi:hypothetical protein